MSKIFVHNKSLHNFYSLQRYGALRTMITVINSDKLLGGYVDRVTDWCVTGRGFAHGRVFSCEIKYTTPKTFHSKIKYLELESQALLKVKTYL